MWVGGGKAEEGKDSGKGMSKGRGRGGDPVRLKCEMCTTEEGITWGSEVSDRHSLIPSKILTAKGS